MSEAVAARVQASIVWYPILVVASLLLPIAGGLAVVLVSRLRRFRERAPRLVVLVAVWLMVTVIQLVALFVSFPISTSIENLNP